jgi:chemotaxis protein CheX
MIDELENMLKTAVGEVFCKMMKSDPTPIPLSSETMGAETHIASAVGFIGDMTGVVYIYASSTFAGKMTSAMLEMPETEVQGDEMVNDAMGELANMIVGTVKAQLVEKGKSCVLTIPSIVRGSNISIEAISSATRRVLCFRCNDNQNLVVEIMIKPPEDKE